MSSVGSPSDDVADHIAQTIISLQRAIVRVTRTANQLPALPTAQAELIFRLINNGPMAPARLASDMQLATPTVSNLVTTMVRAGLLVRDPSPNDGRSVLVRPTEHAEEVITRFGQGRIETVSSALEELSDADRRWIEGALPSFDLLLKAVADMSRDEVERETGD